VHVRVLFPKGQARNVSAVTMECLTEHLYAYDGATETLRKVHSSWRVFFDDPRIKKLFAVNPMTAVEKPAPRRQSIGFYDLATVQRIVDAQPDPARRALFALIYGSAVEVSVALRLTRVDVDPATQEIRTAGTKTHTRDRMARVATWAWPIFWPYAGVR
jgi:site-specific recombinase XerD